MKRSKHFVKRSETHYSIFTRRVARKLESGVTVWDSVPVRCRVDVAIDLEALIAQLGPRALSNKGKRATGLRGVIVVEVEEV